MCCETENFVVQVKKFLIFIHIIFQNLCKNIWFGRWFQYQKLSYLLFVFKIYIFIISFTDSTEPCIKENLNTSTTTVDLCLCKPVEGATHYIVSADTVEGSAYFLRAGQNETDMEDDFEMSEDSEEADKEVTWGSFKEHHNITISSEGASLCGQFTNLTAGRQYNLTVQAIREPSSPLPPMASSNFPYMATTSKLSPLHTAIFLPLSV